MATTPQNYLVREGGATKQKAAVIESQGVDDAGAIPAAGANGRLHESWLPEGVGANVDVAPASEALGAGKFVNLWSDGGVAKYRLADASNNRPADGFVIDAVDLGEDATVFPLDVTNSELSGLTVGATYYLSTAGGVTATPYDESDEDYAGYVSQKLGKAKSATELLTDDFDYVIL